MNTLLKGIILGFSIAAPVGPIGLLCIQRTLASGKLSGFISGLGAALADALYSLVAVLGLTAISSFLLNYQTFFQVIGGAFLFYLGIKTFLTKPEETSTTKPQARLLSDFVSTLFLTITNPLTILTFIALFTGLGVMTPSGNYFSGASLVSGVFVGSASWWLLLSIATDFFRKSLTKTSVIVVNKVSGIIIIAFGCWAFWGFLKHVL